MSSRAGIPPEESLQHHRDSLLDQVIARSLPTREIYEMRGGLSVLVSDKAWSNYFNDVCLEEKDLLEELAHEEISYIGIKKGLKKSRLKYAAKIDDLCAILKKRLDRHDTDSDDEYQPSETMFKIPRK
jgi:hypothetical protein